jgi:FdhE protein
MAGNSGPPSGDPTKSVPKTGTVLGEIAKPPFAVLPDPAALFAGRARRLGALAPGHQLEPYLRFLAAITQAQHDILADLPPAQLPPEDRLAQGLSHGMPPVSRTLHEPDAGTMATIARLLDRLAEAGAAVPPRAAATIAGLREASPDERRRLAHEALIDVEPAADLAQRALLAAGLQVHFARLAAQLDAARLNPVADGACPLCGGPPIASTVVGWPNAHNTRFCTCALCGTMWNVVRVKCVLCTSTDGISFREIEERPTVKAETCEKCRGYVKILYQVNDPPLEALADDVATLGLDMLLAEGGWKRGGANPFLLGY